MIKKVWIENIQQRTVVNGTHFEKGDYIPVTKVIFARLGKNNVVTLSLEAIRLKFGWPRITEKRLLSLVGKSEEGLVEEVLENYDYVGKGHIPHNGCCKDVASNIPYNNDSFSSPVIDTAVSMAKDSYADAEEVKNISECSPLEELEAAVPKSSNSYVDTDESECEIKETQLSENVVVTLLPDKSLTYGFGSFCNEFKHPVNLSILGGTAVVLAIAAGCKEYRCSKKENTGFSTKRFFKNAAKWTALAVAVDVSILGGRQIFKMSL